MKRLCSDEEKENDAYAFAKKYQKAYEMCGIICICR